MARVKGTFELRVKLGKVSEAVADEVFKAVKAGANLVAVEAALSITKGSITGKHHLASKPGEPPNANKRHLDTNIIEVADRATMTARVLSQASYSAALEYGTSRMAARPFMAPALKEHEATARALMAAGVKDALSGRKL